MNEKQLIALWIGIIVIVFMCLFPPWHAKSSRFDLQITKGYAFILNPPKTPLGELRINIRRLFIQCFIVAIITVVFVVTYKYRIPKDKQKEK